MPTLNIKFSGLFLWVPSGTQMIVLAPPTDKGSYAVEPHVTRLLLPESPQLHDVGGTELQLEGTGVASGAMPHNFDCSCDGGVVSAGMLAGRRSATELQNRFILGAGQVTAVAAPVEFHIGAGMKQFIASELIWSYPLPEQATHVTLRFSRLDLGLPALTPITLNTTDGADIAIELHHVPESHLPGGAHSHGPVKPFQLAKHLPALYNVMAGFRTITIPLTTGLHRHPVHAAHPNLGGDPVTCGQGTAKL